MADATQTPGAVRLARYLREIVGLRATTVHDLDGYESVLWFGDIPRDGSCQSPAFGEAGDAPSGPAASGQSWLVVHKQPLPRRPDPPVTILPFVDPQALATAAAEMPKLRPGRERRGDGRSRDIHPDVAAAYEAYRPAWQQWSREYRRLGAAQRVYADLFHMHTQMQKQGEVLELVLGVGLLSWRPASGPAICRHLVTARVDLGFDPATGIMRLNCGVDGAALTVEDDMLDHRLRPARSQRAAIDEQLAALGDDVWNRSLVSALKSFAGALHPDLEWRSDAAPVTAGGDTPVVSLAPAVILRRRTHAGMERVYDTMIERLGGDDAVPAAWLSLAGEDTGDSVPEPLATSDVYFPLPANREQRRIVDAIALDRGVVVQGPPGTGKSHTIANLACHLLATGKRVLITAETGRALKVLKDKLPEDIRPLCVSLLGQGADAFAELNAAVVGITTRYASWHEGAYDDRIADVDGELAARRRLLEDIDAELFSLREEETRDHSVAGGVFEGTAAHIARAVEAERGRMGWLALPLDDGGTAPPDDPPVTAEDMANWLRIRRSHDADAAAAARLRIVGADKLPAPADFAAAVAAENDARAAVDATVALRANSAYAAIAALTEDDREALATKLRQLKTSREALQRRADDKLQVALRAALEGHQAGWQALVDQSRKALGDIDQLLQRIGSHAVTLPANWDLKQVRADVAAVYRHLRDGGRWSGFLYTPGAVRGRSYLRGALKVDGQVADTAERLRLVCDYIDLVHTLRLLDVAWSDRGGLPAASQLRVRVAAIREHVNFYAGAIAYAQTCVHVGRILGTTVPPIPAPDWLNGEADSFLDLIAAARLVDRLEVAAGQVTACLADLKAARDLKDMHPIIGAMVHVIERRDVAAYRHAHQHVQRLEESRRSLEWAQLIEAGFSAAIPALAAAVAASLHDPAWDVRIGAWQAAWRWAVADNWLQRRALGATHRERLWQRREDADAEIASLLAEAAALRAWTHFCRRISAPQAAALRAWRDAVVAMGKATGRAAREQLRQEARDCMDRCRDAIPVWIMPRYLVAEMIEPRPERYDFVIVDEASQLGIDSLFLFYLAERMIVVGDDQQISPHGLNTADDEVVTLQRRHLAGVPFPNTFSGRGSLYGNARIRFAQTVVLREHFRCMPEIIRFSDELCYAVNGTPLDPLRMYAAGRLKPLVIRQVAAGAVTAAGENEAEADAIVAQVMSCIADPRYAGLTMGVISLDGDAQARLIEDRLLSALEPEVFIERRLMCGDAYAFQGDERHVVFLSMVAVPADGPLPALVGEAAQQRFNVAASRAQDQLFLFTSVTLDDLDPACLRHRLLHTMHGPARATAADPPRDPKPRFDHELERDVFRILTERGFHVRTQVCVGDPATHRYRIDIVVEGRQRRLAVECEGDAWHGAERFEADLARQRDLQRAGWQFLRIRGGDFYRDPERATLPLWQALEALGIRPGGRDDDAEEAPPPYPGAADAKGEVARGAPAPLDIDRGSRRASP